MNGKLIIAGLLSVVLLGGLGLWTARSVVVRFVPIHHSGTVFRIDTFRKGGISSKTEGTRQLNQFAILFEDGAQCEGYDTSFANVRVGDQIAIRAYHDVKGWPVLDPEWWECDEAQLISVSAPQ